MHTLPVSNHSIKVSALWKTFSQASKVLLIYGMGMVLMLLVTFYFSLSDIRMIRDVGVWVKPMKFMAASALFSWTTVWLIYLTNSSVGHNPRFNWITTLIITTSLFEVVYITYQGSQGLPSHYNETDLPHLFLFGLMGIAAVGLVFSQLWLAWEIRREQRYQAINVVTLSVLIGLVLTFLLGTVSGFLLGGNQPPVGVGLPIVGWHLHSDARPAHFLAVHAQQMIPLLGLLAKKYLGRIAITGITAASVFYVLVWIGLVTIGISR